MKYEPALPEHNDNVSHERPGREFLTLMLGLTALAALAFWAAGWVVDIGIDHLSPEMEARITSAVSFKAGPEKSFAPEKQAMLQSLADELAACAALPYPVTLSLAESKQPNALALPGGRIVVFSGLIDKLSSRNGLAFVLAHELSHFRNRDHLRALGRGLILIGVSAVLTGSHSDLTQVLTPVSHGGMARHSQQRETAADDNALRILACRYGHAGGATEFFEAMKKEENAGGISHYFSSHPETQARIDNLNRAIARLKLKVERVEPLAR